MKPFRKQRTAALLLVALAGAAAPAPGVGADDRPRRVLGEEIDSRLRLAVERGFRYLISRQTSSGAFSTEYPVAVNALAGLAFLSAGYSGTVGPYTKEFDRCVEHLLGYQQRNGYISDGRSRMYGHGFATLFLAELYGMAGDRDERIRDALARAVKLIEKSQSTDGGWDYEPTASLGSGDTSITVCQTMALRAARNLGIAVDREVVEKARGFILRAQNPGDGGFYYRLDRAIKVLAGSGYPRSAAGVCVLLSLGDYDSEAVQKGFRYLEKNYRSVTPFPFYADYYCTQAMFQAGRHYWRDYFDYLRKKLLGTQRDDGSWHGGYGGPAQSTAMALIALQVPNRYLPITER